MITNNNESQYRLKYNDMWKKYRSDKKKYKDEYVIIKHIERCDIETLSNLGIVGSIEFDNILGRIYNTIFIIMVLLISFTES